MLAIIIFEGKLQCDSYPNEWSAQLFSDGKRRFSVVWGQPFWNWFDPLRSSLNNFLIFNRIQLTFIPFGSSLNALSKVFSVQLDSTWSLSGNCWWTRRPVEIVWQVFVLNWTSRSMSNGISFKWLSSCRSERALSAIFWVELDPVKRWVATPRRTSPSTENWAATPAVFVVESRPNAWPDRHGSAN